MAAKTTKVNTKTEPVKEEVKTVEVKTEVKKETVKKPAAAEKKPAAAEKKPAAKKETAEKKAEEVKTAAEKKPAAKKPAAKAPAKAKAEKEAEVATTVNFQFGGKSYTTEDLLKSCKDVWKYDLGGKEEDIKSVELYVKPEENVTYYVINGDVKGSFFI